MKLEEIKVFYHWVQRFRETDRGQYSRNETASEKINITFVSCSKNLPQSWTGQN